jgi:regulator of protease activity HflC (stomatin/prohibitin superfamily)
MDAFAIFAVMFAILVVLIALMSIKIVPQTENWLVERLGRFHRTLDAGIHIVIPIYDKVAHRESIVERQLPEKVVPAFTKDNVQITIKIAILYRVTDAGRAWYRIRNIDQAIETIVISIVRSTIGSSELDQVQSNRAQISAVIASDIQHVTDEWGIHVTRTEITDVEVDEQTRKAMSMQLNSERTRRALVTEAEGKRQAANFAADAELYTAQQRAQAQRVMAEAQAYAVQTVARAIADNGQAAIDFDVRKIQAEAIKALGQGNATKIVMLPADALTALTGVISRLRM